MGCQLKGHGLVALHKSLSDERRVHNRLSSRLLNLKFLAAVGHLFVLKVGLLVLFTVSVGPALSLLFHPGLLQVLNLRFYSRRLVINGLA